MLRISQAFTQGKEAEEGSGAGEEHRLMLAGRRLQTWGEHRVGGDVQGTHGETGVQKRERGKVQPHLLEVAIIGRIHRRLQLI